MYDIEDRKSAIKEIQRLLSQNETGVYNDKTKDEVIKVQTRAGIEPSGIIDIDTFRIIVDNFRKEKQNTAINRNCPMEGDFPYNQGDYGHDTSMLNSMLSSAIEKHSLALWRPKGAYYSKNTAMAVERIREIFLLPPGTHIDEIFYERLKRW